MLTEKQNNLIDDLANDLKESVEKIERSVETTKGHYGKYMAIIGQMPDKISKAVIRIALKRAGANSYGVDWAFKLCMGESYKPI